MRREERIRIFVDELWTWYDRHKRILPWRDLQVADDTERAYMVLVSEVMLQQTQVSRVIVIFRRFLEQFPTLESLAAASNKDVIIAWKGMGYNSRALRLRDAMRTIRDEHGGVFPREMDQLLAIKGIGAYTAGAVRNFAFNLPTPCIDTNIRRVLHRTFIGPEREDGTWEKDDTYLLELAGEVLEVALASEKRSAISDQRTARDTANWHAALMDFGSLVCTKSNPKWDICPLTMKGICLAAYKTPKRSTSTSGPPKKSEPGRLVGSVFIPNRIFRGRIVDELRSAPEGLSALELGHRITVDWEAKAHRAWLDQLLEKLVTDRLVALQGEQYRLAD